MNFDVENGSLVEGELALTVIDLVVAGASAAAEASNVLGQEAELRDEAAFENAPLSRPQQCKTQDVPCSASHGTILLGHFLLACFNQSHNVEKMSGRSESQRMRSLRECFLFVEKQRI